MKSHFVLDLQKLEIGERFQSPFRLTDLERREKATGGAYLTLTLMDRTGAIVAKWWDCSEADCCEAFRFRYAHVDGRIKDYQGRKEVHLAAAPAWLEEPEDTSPYEQVAALPLPALHARLTTHIASIQHPALKCLLDRLFGETKFLARFAEAPGAARMHHACRHGLLQHTLEVADLAAKMADAQETWGYAPVSRDLVVAGALLHDVGKVDELTWDGEEGYGLSRRGALLGHVSIGIQRVSREMNAIPAFPATLKDALMHIVASHHGKKEWGSPVAPMFPEAQIVHAADLLDVQLFYMQEATAGATEEFVKVWKLDKQLVYARPWDAATPASDTDIAVPSPLTAGDSRVPPKDLATPGVGLPMLRFRAAPDGAVPSEIKVTAFRTRRLPLAGRTAAGGPILAIEHIEDYYEVEESGLPLAGDLFLLRVAGDSMTGDGIGDGDLVVVRRQEDHDPNDIVVVLQQDADEAAIKRVRIGGDGRLFLVSSNPAFAPIPVLEPATLLVRGRVLAVARV